MPGHFRLIGTTLGHYAIESLLGAGGMGTVYRARDTKLGRGVAIKVLPDEFAFDPERVARFEREAKVLASLNHPHIAALHGMDQADGRTFLIMELVEGETLAERLRRGPLAVEEALRIAGEMAEGLEAAHEIGVVHRDLKPANVKITPDENVKVLDFGLAKAMEAGGPGRARLRGDAASAGQAGGDAGLTHSPTLSMMATQAGMILGTAAYMSPEQAKGMPADHRADVFSFGVVLYEMLIGRQPFQGETAPEVLASVLIREADVTALPSGLNPRLSDLLRRCLDKNPKRRWQAIGDLRVELEAIAAAPRALPAVPAAGVALQQPLWRRAIPIAVAAVVFAVLGGGAVAWRMRTPPAPAAIVKFPLILPQDQTLTRAPSIALSADGARIAYVANQQIYLRSMGDMESHPIPGTNLDAFRPFFSPDGQWVGFYSFQDSTLKKIAVTGGSAVTLYKASSINIYGASWYGDQIVLADPAKGIMRVSDAGGEPTVLAEVKPPDVPEGPQMLDDDTLLFTTTAESGATRWDKGQIVVQSLRSGARKVVFRGGTGRYVPTGHLVYALGSTLLALPFDVKSREVRGGPVPVVEGVRRGVSPANQSGIAGFAVSASGALVYVPGGAADASVPRTLTLVDRSGKAEPLALPAQPYQHPRISPDGQQLVVATDDGKDAVVWVADLRTGGTLRRLTFGGRNLNPIWTPDSRSITFQSDREGDRGSIFQQLADGSRAAERLTKAEQGTAHAPESWSPDGKTLTLRIGSPATTSVWTMAAGDKAPKRFDETITANHFNSSFSPDGRWLAYTSTELNAVPRVFVQPFPRTGAKYQLPTDTDRGASPRWSSDGRQIFYDGGTSGRVMVLDVGTAPSFTFGRSTPIQTPGIDKPSSNWRPYDVTPDGKKLLVVTIPQSDARGAAPRTEINVVLNWLEELKARVPTAGR